MSSPGTPTKGGAPSIIALNQKYKTDDAALLQKATVGWLEEALQVVLSDKSIQFDQLIKNGFILAHLGKVVCAARQRQTVQKLPRAEIRRKATESVRGYSAVANVDSFLQACREFGLKDHELCSISDCVDSKNLTAVCNNVRCLAVALELHSPPITLVGLLLLHGMCQKAHGRDDLANACLLMCLHAGAEVRLIPGRECDFEAEDGADEDPL
eukprot:scaffold3886_cov399-Prasinococcus_capsulatus_cf.AAC.25